MLGSTLLGWSAQRLRASLSLWRRSTRSAQPAATAGGVTQLLDLLRLHPQILAQVRALPPGTPPRLVTERKLRSLVRLPAEAQLKLAVHLFQAGRRRVLESKSSSG